MGEEGLYCKYAEQLSVNTCLCLPVADNEVQGLGSPVSGTQPDWQRCYLPPHTQEGQTELLVGGTR